jgi:hypothetical protein
MKMPSRADQFGGKGTGTFLVFLQDQYLQVRVMGVA